MKDPIRKVATSKLLADLKRWQEAAAQPLPTGIAAMPTMQMYDDKITSIEDELKRRGVAVE